MSQLIATVVLLSIFLITIGVHELGHYLYAKSKNCNPKLRIRYWGLWFEVDGFFEHLSFKEQIYLNLSGIIMGYAPVLLVFHNNHLGFVTILYIGISAADLVAIFGLCLLFFKYGNRKIGDIPSLI